MAAGLAQARWPDTTGSLTLGVGLNGRMGFGVKHLAKHGRRTVESDVLISEGSIRRGVDVKFSRTGVYRHVIAPSVLAGIQEALLKRELTSFHWVTPGRFFAPRVHRAAAAVPGRYLHESVWTSPDDTACIQTIQRQALNVRAIIRDWQRGAVPRLLDLGRRLFEASWGADERAWGGSDDLLETTTRDGFTYLFDARAAASSAAPGRCFRACPRSGSVPSAIVHERISAAVCADADRPRASDRANLRGR